MKRALLVMGAGSALEFGAPSTSVLTTLIEQGVQSDQWMKKTGADNAYRIISDRLKAYLKDPKDVNFEHIYHCAHELIFTNPPEARSVNEFRPLLIPFLRPENVPDEQALRALCEKIVKIVYQEISTRCDIDATEISSLHSFIKYIRKEHQTRIYTTNYDDFILQACPDFYTGFVATEESDFRRFDADDFWSQQNRNCVYHLHGSVHLGFPHPIPRSADIGELVWFDDRSTALKYSQFSGSDFSRMDGSSILRTSIITGLDKLSRLQQRPFSYFYAALAQDAMKADIIFVIGSGLADLHLNTWLREARRKNPKTPLVLIDFWTQPFWEAAEFDPGPKEVKMFHDLRIHIRLFEGKRIGDGWTLSPDHSAVVWEKGFKGFLNALDEFPEILTHLNGVSSKH